MAEDGNKIFDEEPTDFYDEFKERMRQEPIKSVLAKRNKQSRPASGAITLIIGVILVALVVWYVVEKYFTAEEDIATAEIPVIQADDTPVKVKPENAGGMDIPGRDKSVYSRIGRTDEPKAEKLLSRTEEPTPVVEDDEDDDEELVAAPSPAKQPVVEPSPPQALSKLGIAPDKTKEATPPALVETKTPAAPPSATTTPAAPAAEEVKVMPLYTPQVTSVTKPPKAPAPAVSPASGDWKVQILSSKQRDAVEKTWESTKAKNLDILASVPYEIVAADLGEKGTFYRLRIGSFKSRTDADALCQQLKARKLDCFVVR